MLLSLRKQQLFRRLLSIHGGGSVWSVRVRRLILDVVVIVVIGTDIVVYEVLAVRRPTRVFGVRGNGCFSVLVGGNVGGSVGAGGQQALFLP